MLGCFFFLKSLLTLIRNINYDEGADHANSFFYFDDFDSDLDQGGRPTQYGFIIIYSVLP